MKKVIESEEIRRELNSNAKADSIIQRSIAKRDANLAKIQEKRVQGIVVTN
jgi:hypothetical protein